MLRRALLAVAASEQIRRFVAAAPATRAVVDRYVAGDSISDAVRVAGRCAPPACWSRLTTWARTPRTHGWPTLPPRSTCSCSASWPPRGSPRAARSRCRSSRPPSACCSTSAMASDHIERIAIAAREAGTTVTVDAEDHRTDRRRAADRDRAAVQAPVRRQRDTGVAAPHRGGRAGTGRARRPGAAVQGRLRRTGFRAFTGRHDIDKSFARCLRILMSGPGYPMIATHDPRLIKITRSLAAAPAGLQLRAPDAVRGQARRSSAGSPRPAARCGCTCRTAATGTATWCAGWPSARRTWCSSCVR